MALDEIFNKEERDAQYMQTDIQRFKKIAIALGLLCIALAYIFVVVSGELDKSNIWALPLGLTIIVLGAGLILTFFVALIPYQDFDYMGRFLRYYLMVLLFLYGLFNAFWFLAIVSVYLS